MQTWSVQNTVIDLIPGMILDPLLQSFVQPKASLSLFSDSQPIFLPSYVFSLLSCQPKPMKVNKYLEDTVIIIFVLIHKPFFVAAAQPQDFLLRLAFPFDELL